MLRLVSLLTAVASTVAAQNNCRDSVRVADLGYGVAVCHDCVATFRHNSLLTARFNSPPAIYQVRADGPAAGKLKDGDTLVAVNGRPITDDAASMDLVNWRPEVLLSVRRNGTDVNVRLNPRAVCMAAGTSLIPDADSLARASAWARYSVGIISREEYERIRGNVVAADSLARDNAKRRYQVGMITRAEYERTIGNVGVADSLERVNLKQRFDAGVIGATVYQREMERLQRAADVRGERPLALGLTLQCSACSTRTVADGKTVWTFTHFPIVASVEAGSFADRLGLRQGDTLVAIDGQSLKTEAGGARLGAAATAREVMLSWRRSGMAISARGTILPSSSSSVRTSQKVGNTTVDVRGTKAVWSVDPATGQLQVSGDSITVTITPEAASSGRRPRPN